MERNIIMAGFGGQGVMLMGKLLCFAVNGYSDQGVTFFPSYGAEQRGGTANCYVVVSDERVGSPMPSRADDLIVLNQPPLNKFADKLKTGGTLFVNSSIVKDLPDRSDIRIVSVPATELALEIGNERTLNIIMLGVYTGYTGLVPEDVMLDTVVKKLGKKPSMITVNQVAFRKGLEIGKKAAQETR